MQEFLHFKQHLPTDYAVSFPKNRANPIFVENNHEILSLWTCILYAISVIK